MPRQLALRMVWKLKNMCKRSGKWLLSLSMIQCSLRQYCCLILDYSCNNTFRWAKRMRSIQLSNYLNSVSIYFDFGVFSKSKGILFSFLIFYVSIEHLPVRYSVAFQGQLSLIFIYSLILIFWRYEVCATLGCVFFYTAG